MKPQPANPLDDFEGYCYARGVNCEREGNQGLRGDFSTLTRVYRFSIGWLENVSSFRITITTHETFTINENQRAAIPYINDFLWLGQMLGVSEKNTVLYRHTSPPLAPHWGKQRAGETLEMAFDECEKAHNALYYCRGQGSFAVEAAFLDAEGNS